MHVCSELSREIQSSVVLDHAGVVGEFVVVAVPDHEAAVVVRLLRGRRDVVVDVLGVHPAVRHLRRREADVEPGGRVRRRPLVPREVPPGLAVGVVVDPDVDALEDARVERAAQVAGGREPAARRGRQVQRLAGPAADVVLGELERQHVVAVGGRAALQEQVDAVEPRVAEGAAHARLRPAEEGVPEVVEQVQRRLRRRERVAGAEAADGERHRHAHELAVLDVVPDAGRRVARQVQVVLVAAALRAVDVEEGHDHHGVEARVAGLAQRALGLVPAPEHGHLPGLVPRGRGWAGQGDQGHRKQG
uniref:Uncharacterized protein n=1 Tax=Zea mays TaxID=4577 RepID=A0A804Q652_MAIZE